MKKPFVSHVSKMKDGALAVTIDFALDSIVSLTNYTTAIALTFHDATPQSLRALAQQLIETADKYDKKDGE